MTLLSDKTIAKLIENGLITNKGEIGFDFKVDNKIDSPIQASSLDLHIGSIYSPQNCKKALDHHVLKSGETIVIKTLEKLDIPLNIGAIGTIPSHYAKNGILATNPGHIDPGYNGFLHLTLINMGKEDWPVEKETSIISLMFFLLDEDAVCGYMKRLPESNDNNCDKDTELIETTLNNLSVDFMNFKGSSKRIAKRITKNVLFKHNLVPIIITIIIFVMGFAYQLFNYNTLDRLKDLENKVNNTYVTADRFRSLEMELTTINNKVGNLDASVNGIIEKATKSELLETNLSSLKKEMDLLKEDLGVLRSNFLEIKKQLSVDTNSLKDGKQ